MTQPPPPEGPQPIPAAPGPGATPPTPRHGRPEAWAPPPGAAGPGEFRGYPPAPHAGWAPGYPPPYPPPQQPFPPPRGPRAGMIVGTVLGVVTIIAVIGVSILLSVAAETDSSSSYPGNQTVAPGIPTGETANAADATAIRSAMQRFVNAVNSRDVARIQASVCTALRPQVTVPIDVTGNVVLEELTDITVTGDSAASTVSTHVELGNQRSLTKQNDESFAREGGTWYVCPGTQLDMGT